MNDTVEELTRLEEDWGRAMVQNDAEAIGRFMADDWVIIGPIADPNLKPYDNGVLLWFELEDFDSALARARELKAEVVKPRHRNPASGGGGPNHWECWLRDPDGYTVVLASPDGSAGNVG